MDHRSVSLQFIRTTGLIPVKVMPGQKGPAPEDWDPRKILGRDHEFTLTQLEHETKYNVGGLFHGKWVDIDVDTTNPYLHAALDILLPTTPYVWGRKSKPRSHRVYQLFEPFDRGPYGPLLGVLKKLVVGEVDDQSYSVEVRGGKPENGLFTVLPGSFRADVNEHVLWDRDIDPTVSGASITITNLLRFLRIAVVAAMVAPHWVEGVRNDMSLALAGVLWRIRKTSMAVLKVDTDDEIPPDFYVHNEDDAKRLFQTIMRLAGDDKNDERSRLLNLSNTWEKLDKGSGNITGGKALAEMMGDVGKKLVRKMYRLLSDGDNTEAIEKLAEQYVIWYGPGLLIDLELVHTNHTAWMTRQQAQNSMGGESIKIGENKLAKVDLLFGTKLIHRTFGLTFDPSKPEILVQGPNDRLMVNQWQGFATEPSPQRVTPGEVEMFTDYIHEVIANGDKEAAEWVFSWLADIIRDPSQKCGTALVLVGLEGAGKSFLGEHFLGPIIGNNHYAQVDSVEAITDKFNSILDNRIFVLCDESKASAQGGQASASKLRGIITGPGMWIEPKGINRYEKPNHLRLMFTSNKEHNPLWISSDRNERRFTVLKVSEAKIGNRRYWNDMLLWSKMMRPKVMRWLLDYPVNKDSLRRPYDTKIKREIQRVGLDIEVSWVLARVAAGFPIGDHTHKNWYQAYHQDNMSDADKRQNTVRRDVWPNRVSLAALEDDYRDFIRAYGKSVYSGSLNTTIRKVLPPNSLRPLGQQTVRYVNTHTGQVIQNRVRMHDFPTAEEIVGFLRNKFGALIDGLMDEVASMKDLGGPPSDRDREY